MPIGNDDLALSAKALWYTLLGTSVLVFVVTTIYMVRPVWLGFERQAVKASHQYIEANETALLAWIDEHKAAQAKISEYELRDDADSPKVQRAISDLKQQQRYLQTQVQTHANRVKSKGLPPAVHDFLNAQLEEGAPQ